MAYYTNKTLINIRMQERIRLTLPPFGDVVRSSR